MNEFVELTISSASTRLFRHSDIQVIEPCNNYYCRIWVRGNEEWFHIGEGYLTVLEKIQSAKAREKRE